MATIVLVHGAWSDESVWEAVIEHLHAGGHGVRAVPLPLTSLDDDVDATRRAMAGLAGPLTLVGHSYGGVVVSEAARGDNAVGALVFVAAYAPDQGESIASMSRRGALMPGSTAIRYDDHGWTTLDPERFPDVLAADLPVATARGLAARQKPTHVSCLTTAAGRGSWHELPCAYVLSTDDQILDPGLQRGFAGRIEAVPNEVASSHLSPVSHAREVAAVIGDLAEQTAAGPDSSGGKA